MVQWGAQEDQWGDLEDLAGQGDLVGQEDLGDLMGQWGDLVDP